MTLHARAALIKHRNVIVYFLHGAFLGGGINYYFSYQVMTHPFSIDFYASLILLFAPLISLLFSTQCFWSKVKLREKIKKVLLGIATISTIIAVFSFIQNLAWFISGGYLTIVNVPTGPGQYVKLTVYPPELIYNLLKSTFLASVSGFMERIIKIPE